MASARMVCVGGSDDTLSRALGEHRPAAGGWDVGPLDGQLESGALVILDFDGGADQRIAIDAARAGGFGGRILVLGGGDVAGRGNEPVRRPVRLGALLARIEAHWAEAENSTVVALGPYTFVAQDSTLRAAADSIRLTELECRLLNFLAEARGALVSRERLLEGVWGYSAELDTHTVETHIWRLRQKVETDDPATRFLVTETGGYRLLSCGLPETR